MIVPVLIFWLLCPADADMQRGMAIPMATDIAFSLGVLAIFSKRVPLGLKVFLAALAVADDLGGIIVIALFYSSDINVFYLGLSALCVGILCLGNIAKIRTKAFYISVGVALWYLMLNSGIHATIAGVILALTIPSKTVINEVRFSVSMKYWLGKFKEVSNNEIVALANTEQQHIIHEIGKNVKNINPLIHKFEAGLHPWVTFFIMPDFALANAGVELSGGIFSFPLPDVALGIFFGLLCGKPIGIFLFSFLAVKTKIAELPKATTWLQVLALGIIAGIGFTMSIFIDGLAFEDQNLINIGKAAILGTSFVAALVGCLAVYMASGKLGKEN
jgi:NhaA family Na+:H+ antiporter